MRLDWVQRRLRRRSSPLTVLQPPSTRPRVGPSSSPTASARVTTSTCKSSSLWSHNITYSDNGARRQCILCCVDSRVVILLQEAQSRIAEACLRVPRLLAHRRPALGTIVGQPGGCDLTAFLSGTLAPRRSDLARTTS